ncbi:MAG: hypothetical protein COT39_00100 [Parcubacteria group bacterium CG08_land_8_20_14_0_20_48_21]|nr:MAG: hypothetical protein AUK21_01030 [Parcubacteria group bacterium CG2_30_48_51]PIS33266.1 MAG: hypothetical protein COT39_00100 [Parcubacteria group bacterium CG08_land_8_20_14_0_20_48_21]PIW79279.1 MAG: hypothetical protein COZ99_01985 [Parcubacteria group bacterium CG_4_8_14_3_um_filter_48_16]PIY77760.1 MAG: hypothetical protein COY83_03500 [Parcubacteria group bacterium CG_4_10_14_0_8_um_filter_48_154]PIZ78107.1 MAG: hypothetical protein COY03_00320 [bacterium CG_4_10_14_0_2_um_filter_
MLQKKSFFFVLLLISIAALARLMPHPWNFTPIGAAGLFAGKYLQKKWAFVVPLAAMALADLWLGWYDWRLMIAVYASMAAYTFLGVLVRAKGFVPTATATLAGSLQFFLLTNGMVWVLSAWYPHTLQGLLTAYTLGVPFFKYTLAGDVLYVGVFVLSFVFAQLVYRQLTLAPRSNAA